MGELFVLIAKLVIQLFSVGNSFAGMFHIIFFKVAFCRLCVEEITARFVMLQRNISLYLIAKNEFSSRYFFHNYLMNLLATLVMTSGFKLLFTPVNVGL